MPDTNTDPVRHITVDASSLEDDELIEIGVPQDVSSVAGTSEVSWEDEEIAPPEDNGAAPYAETTYESEQGRSTRNEYSYEDDEDDVLPDYSLDDLKPMPIMQKVILVVLIAAVVVAAAWIFDHFFGLGILLGA